MSKTGKTSEQYLTESGVYDLALFAAKVEMYRYPHLYTTITQRNLARELYLHYKRYTKMRLKSLYYTNKIPYSVTRAILSRRLNEIHNEQATLAREIVVSPFDTVGGVPHNP